MDVADSDEIKSLIRVSYYMVSEGGWWSFGWLVVMLCVAFVCVLLVTVVYVCLLIYFCECCLLVVSEFDLLVVSL